MNSRELRILIPSVQFRYEDYGIPPIRPITFREQKNKAFSRLHRFISIIRFYLLSVGCFIQFDKITSRWSLEKLKTIGDSYMSAVGIPSAPDLANPQLTNALRTVLAGFEIQNFMNTMKSLKSSLGIPYWELRLGIHTGPLVAGVIGEKKFAYDVWGDTVNTASRMESSGKEGRINISEATYNLVKDYFVCEYRGKVNAKNKGEIAMYYVNAIKENYANNTEGRVPNQKLLELL
ncbi:MAG: adenylate/guanylate cyclase domain-containing protein [Leptospira sp.]|nr:adenylate/guanylate cyclase domain-containing protein [Leptospira sp.]